MPTEAAQKSPATEAARTVGQRKKRVYHAGKPGFPKCGQRGLGDRYNVIVLPAPDWNATPAEERCAKCAEIIRAKKSAAEARAAIAKAVSL